jgi:hypothetical protein
MNILQRNIEIIDDVMADMWRNKTHGEKLLIVCNMWSSAKKLLTGHLKAEHPDWDEKRIHKEVVKRLSHGNV